MKFSKKLVLSTSLSIVLSSQLLAQSFSAGGGSLEDAIKDISKQSNMTYMVDTRILDGKKAPNIKDIEGVQNALNELLKGTDLEAIINDNTIVIRKVSSVKVINGTYILDDVSVNTGKNGSAEAGYLTENITGVGLWGKRSLQDTPYSMNIITKDLIENVQANDMAPIFKMNPTTQNSMNEFNGANIPYMRGFDVSNSIINGMPIAGWYSFITMEDLERVETISGATGFLYGGGRVGGAVNYVTKKPTLENQRSIKIGNYGGEQYYGHIDLSGQIDDKNIFGYRINALYQDGDSVNDLEKEQKYVSLAFDFKPTDNFTMDLNYAHRDLEKTIKPLFYIGNNMTRPNLDVSKSYSADWASTEEENDRVMTSLKWDINDIFTLRSSLSYEESKHKYIGEQIVYMRPDGLYDVETGKYSSIPNEYEGYSGNIYLDSKFETLGINHLLTVGYSENYLKFSRPEIRAEYEFFAGVTLDQIKNLPSVSTTVHNSKLIPSWKTQYKNILIGDDIVFNDKWSALVGANYATIISTRYNNSGIQSSKYDVSELTPTLSLMYKPFEDLTTYATYIESLEAGTIVGNIYANENEILDPYKSKQYEIGAKYSLNESILLTGALFRIEKANSYIDNSTVASLGKPTLTKDGEQIHQGIEVGLTGKVTDNLTLMGGVTFMDLSVEKHSNKAIEGKKPIEASTKMAKLYSEYNIPFVSGLTVTGGAYYTGKKYVDSANTDKIPSYTLFDAGLRYKTKVDKYPTTFLLNVSNLTGKDYWASGNYLGDPRSVAFSMKMEF
ncbi:TonB-dependent siderophore receptor [Aliarcobacter vitoriensis]|uniref:TonB-dependent siderophore receptor n=1 Tax=Aliarcobacter vitoriensis TaxID=2011099 RepID=UPI003AB04C48